MRMDQNPARPRILIIDDDRQLCELLTIWLSERFDVETAYDGETGLEKAARVAPQVVLLDVMMPKLSGFSLAWVFRHNPLHQGAVVIFVTAIEVNRRSRQQADGYLKKPFTRSELTEIVDRALLQRRLAPPTGRPCMVDEMSDGQRRAPRVNVAIPATLEVEGAVLEGSIRCLSPWGAFFATDATVPFDRSGRVRFASDSSSFELDSYPIYQSSHDGLAGVGLRIRPAELDAESRLYELIEKHLPVAAA